MTIMMKLAAILAVVVAAAVVPVVVQAQENPCDDLSKKKCEKLTECTFVIFDDDDDGDCLLTAGEDSVVRQGKDNVSPGNLNTVGGGKLNDAGDDSYCVIGGGKENFLEGDKSTIAGGNSNLIESNIGSTISGGSLNQIFQGTSFSVITGGGDGSSSDDFSSGNTITNAKEATISGGEVNFLAGEKGVVTGGQDNTSGGKGSVVMGGRSNEISGNGGNGIGSVIIGGKSNTANGANAIAFGENAFITNDSSMAVNLIEGNTLETTEKGQFLVKSESYRFQIGNGNNKNGGISSFKITDENINRLIEALLPQCDKCNFNNGDCSLGSETSGFNPVGEGAGPLCGDCDEPDGAACFCTCE